MKVLHLISGNLAAGAARGAYWLHQAMVDAGIDSRILTNSKNIYNDPRIVSLSDTKICFVTQYIRMLLDHFYPLLKGYRKKYIFSTGLFGYDFRKTTEYKEADIIHLHWVNKGFVKIRHLKNVSKPVVWTMRDMWLATGGCHLSMGCDRYQIGCGQCPQIQSNAKEDLSTLIYNNKINDLPDTLTVVGISDWITGVAKKSLILKDKHCRTIFNAINTKHFYPLNKMDVRKELGLPANKKIILFGASDPAYFCKGFDLLTSSLAELNPDKFHLLSFGNQVTLPKSISIPHTQLGYLHDFEDLRKAYSVADVFVVSSIQDTFGKTLVESMACGTPVVCFDATGPGDIVDHQINGYKAKAFDTTDLANGIKWVVEQQSIDNQLVTSAREKVERCFTTPHAAQQYITLYKNLVSRDI